MVFKNIYVIVFWMKVASALEGLNKLLSFPWINFNAGWIIRTATIKFTHLYILVEICWEMMFEIVVILCHVFGQSLLSYCVYIAQMSNIKLISRGFEYVFAIYDEE